MSDVLYVRGKLEEARKERGRIAIVARETCTDRRTVLAILGNRREPQAATIDKLSAYFKKADRRAKA